MGGLQPLRPGSPPSGRRLQIVRYGKAVGLLVWHGGHAVVMNGFTSTRNPLDGDFTVTGTWASDPYGASNRYYSAASCR